MDIFSQKNVIMVFAPKNKANEWKRIDKELNDVREWVGAVYVYAVHAREKYNRMIKISR